MKTINSFVKTKILQISQNFFSEILKCFIGNKRSPQEDGREIEFAEGRKRIKKEEPSSNSSAVNSLIINKRGI